MPVEEQLTLRQRAAAHWETEQALTTQRNAEEVVKFRQFVTKEANRIFGENGTDLDLSFSFCYPQGDVIYIEEDIILAVQKRTGECSVDTIDFRLTRRCSNCRRLFIPDHSSLIFNLAELGRALAKETETEKRGGEDLLCSVCAPKYQKKDTREPIERIADALEAIAGVRA